MRTNIDQAEYLGENVILTPHPGELGRLMDSSAKEAAKNLLYFAEELQKKFGCICVCKDARTVILTQKNRYLNLTGNSGMATGGSGDVLTRRDRVACRHRGCLPKGQLFLASGCMAQLVMRRQRKRVHIV